MIRRLVADALERVVGGFPEEAARERRPREIPRPTVAPRDRRGLDAERTAPWRPPPAPAPSPSAPERHGLAAALASRSELRRAFLLMEILGPPAALRGPGTRR
jgi:hypothetical protein